MKEDWVARVIVAMGNLQKLTLALWEHLCSDDPLDEPSRRSAEKTANAASSHMRCPAPSGPTITMYA